MPCSPVAAGTPAVEEQQPDGDLPAPGTPLAAANVPVSGPYPQQHPRAQHMADEDSRISHRRPGGALLPRWGRHTWPETLGEVALLHPERAQRRGKGALRFLQLCCPPWWTSTAMAHSLVQGAATAWCYRVLKRHRPSSPQVPSFTGVSESYGTSEQVGVVCPRVLASSGPRELPRRSSEPERNCLSMQASFSTDFLMVRGHLTRKAIRFFEVAL